MNIDLATFLQHFGAGLLLLVLVAFGVQAVRLRASRRTTDELAATLRERMSPEELAALHANDETQVMTVNDSWSVLADHLTTNDAGRR